MMNKRVGLGKIKDSLGELSYFDEEANGAEIFKRKKESGIYVGITVAILFFLALTLKLFFLQVQEGFVNLRLAEGNSVKSLPVSAPRGLIVDDKGQPLASNQPAYDLVTQINRPKDLDKFGANVFEIIGLSQDQVKGLINANNKTANFIILKENMSRDDALLLKSRLAQYGGFEVTPSFVRQYFESSLCHVLGYIGKLSEGEATGNPLALINGTTGKSSLEKTYDEFLQGTPGERRAEVDASGRVIRILSQTDPQSGDTIQTSIDKDLQVFVSQKLEESANELKTNAAAVVMDARDGSIKALVSLPNFDNTALSTGITQEQYNVLAQDKNFPLLNRAIAGEYPPGSSIKPFIASSALEFGVVDPNFSFDTPPFIDIGGHKFPDWKDHGTTDIRRAIAESNNIFFFALGGGYGPIKNGLGPDGIKKGLDKFGFGSQTSIDLTGESDGFIPTPEWKKKNTKENWFIGNTYNMSIGQGDLLVTPIQMAVATVSIANGGKLFKPHLVKKITDLSGNIVEEFNSANSLIKDGIFSPSTLQVVREGMRMTVTNGSAASVFGSNFPISVAGKTGTAQFGNEGKTHAWFTSFAPYEDPKIAVTILVEGGGEGFETAAPVARDILKWWSENRK